MRNFFFFCVVCWIWPITSTVADQPSSDSGVRGTDSIDLGKLKIHTRTLADDALQGREAGSPGGNAAAAYIVKCLTEYGLAAAGDGGTFYQPFGKGYRNILAVCPGTDPQLSPQHIIVSAHYDHVGLGSTKNSKGAIGQIHNGADDNASGVAALLEVARLLRQTNRLRRSVVIAFWDAEEKGLLGAKHWVQQPTVALDSVRYLVNADMIGRLEGQGRLSLFGTRTMPELRRLWSTANDGMIPLEFPWTVINNSDHYVFFQKGIPITMVHTGLHDDYHRPSDDVELLDHAGIQRTAELMTDLITAVANQDRLPSFRKASWSEGQSEQRYFERPFREKQRRIGLTVQPRKGTAGLEVESVWVGSPANLAGVRPGEVILSANGVDVSTAASLRTEIAATESVLTLIVLAGPTERSVELRLAAKPQRIGISWRANDAEPQVVMFSGIVPGSPAALAGCQVRDRLLRVNDQRVESSEWLRQQLELAKDQWVFLLERDGQLKTVNVVVSPPAD